MASDTEIDKEIIDGPGSISRLISASYILRTGEIPIGDDSFLGLAEIFYPSYNVDWRANDTFTLAIDEAFNEMLHGVLENPALQDLLKKDSWNKADRCLWEKELTAAMHEALSNVCGGNLQKYRNDWLDEGVTRSSSLNELSEDLQNNTQTMENDCDTMAIVQAVLMQRVENHFLGHGGDEENTSNMRNPTTYYVAYGRLAKVKTSEEDVERIMEKLKDQPKEVQDHMRRDLEGFDQVTGKEGKEYHAVVISCDSGCVIEPTNGTYFVPYNHDTIKDYTNGVPILMASGENHFATDGSVISIEEAIIVATDINVAEAENLISEMIRVYESSKLSRDMDAIEEKMDNLKVAVKEVSEDPGIQTLIETLKSGSQSGLDDSQAQIIKSLLQDPEVCSLLSRVYDDYLVIQNILLESAKNSSLGTTPGDITRLENAAKAFLDFDPVLMDVLPDVSELSNLRFGHYKENKAPYSTPLESANEVKNNDITLIIDHIQKTRSLIEYSLKQDQATVDRSIQEHGEVLPRGLEPHINR